MLVNQEKNQWYYKIAYFIIANQVVFKRLLVVLLILLNIILWWSSGVKLVNHLSDISNYNQILQHLTENQINWSDYHSKNKPQELEIVEINKIKIDNDKYDLVAKVYNPNSQWYIKEINYTFIVDDYLLDWQTDFVLPEQNKYLFNFSYFSNTPVKDVSLRIDNIHWKRIKDKDKINLLDNIVIQNKNFSTSKNISQVKFKIINNTHYSFWQTGWQIVLYQGKRPMAVNYVTSNNFLTGEEKQITAAWTENISYPSKTDIIPDINIFDDSNYITDLDIPPVNLIRGAAYPPSSLTPSTLSPLQP